MAQVFLLWHTHHDPDLDGSEDVKLVGVYSTIQLAEQAQLRAEKLPGFKDQISGFEIAEYELDKDQWTTGYSTLTGIYVPLKDGSWTIVEAECLPGKQYKIIEHYRNDLLGEFKHLDIVQCEEREGALYVVAHGEEKTDIL